MSDWDMEYDVVVIGSGNGALTAAITAKDFGSEVVVLEKADTFGGTSATSGGGVWIPNNRYARAAGAEDSEEDAFTYARAMSDPADVPDEMLHTYVREGPKMIDYLHENTRWVRYRNLAHYPDYFPDAPGGRPGNRSMEPEPIHASALGGNVDSLQPQHGQTQMPGGVSFTQVEGQMLLGALSGWVWLAARLILGYIFDFRARIHGWRDWRLTMGNAGIARLWLSLQDRGIPLHLKTPMKSLISEDGRVVGVVAEQQGKELRIRARKGVILAAGGFERNQELREKYLPHPTNANWTAAHFNNTGDALTAALEVGAGARRLDWAWWTTTAVIPGRQKAQMMMVEKSMPGNYTVNQNGERFSNESQNYVSFIEDMFRNYNEGNPCIPCYMIFDADFRRQRPCGPIVQSKLMPDWMLPRAWWTPSFLMKADSLRELARKIGIDGDRLEETQRKVNEYARTGKDEDFKRGDNVYDRYYGDPSITPNPCLGPLKKPPFYSMALFPGEMGTAGGLIIDTKAQVQNENGEPIPGLYAAGNCTNALLPRYPGPGSTLGPAMVFGHIAGRSINEADA